jgi:hypothetical protein
MFEFLKSKAFWLSVAHLAVVAGGAYAAFAAGSPLPLVISSGINALAPSPMPSKAGGTT